MKTIISLIGIFLICANLFAQSPHSFNYQAILRDNSGLAISNQSVNMQFTILQGTPAVNSMYSETQTLITDANGLISTAIGNGMPVSGNFANIDWSVGPFFIKVELDADNSGTFIEMGTTQLLSVPFALYAENAGNSFSGDYNDLSNKPQNVSTFSNDAGYITVAEDSTNELQNLSISNDSLFISKTNSVKLPGVKVSEFIVPITALSSFTSTSSYQYFKMGDIGSFIKDQDSTLLELFVNCHAVVQSFSSCNAVLFQIRIDDQPTTLGYMEFPIFNPNTSYTYFSPTGFFKDIPAGTHTISVWVGTYHSGSTATNIIINPGGFGLTSRMMIKEYYGTHQ